MLDGFVDLLAKSQPLLLFTVIGVGWIIGQIKILGFHMGVAAVLFVGLAFSAYDNRLILDEVVFVLGLVLFVYTIGLQSGPDFFAALRKTGRRANAVTLVALVAGALVTYAMFYALHLPGPLATGLFCGATTNTPALAAANETLAARYAGAAGADSAVAADTTKKVLSQPTVGYSLAYPFGVLGLLLAIEAMRRLGRPNYREEEAQDTGSGSGAGSEVLRQSILVQNCNDANPAFAVSALAAQLGVVFSRMERNGQMKVVQESDVLVNGDIVVAVGTETAVANAILVLGVQSAERIDMDDEHIERRLMFVSSRNLIGMQIRSLKMERFGARISRVVRNGVEYPAQPDTIIQPGDQALVVAPAARLGEISGFLGNSFKSIVETDFLSIALGLVLGVLVGMIPIPLTGGTFVKLGFAGGPLIVSLVLGRLVRSGGIVWALPLNANLTLRQVGLLFFLAGIGTKAGLGFLDTFRQYGTQLVLAGAVITLVTAVTCLVLARCVLRFTHLSSYGIMTGTHTQPAALAYANQISGSDYVTVAYGTVYPLAMILKVVIAQMLVTVFPLP